MSFTQSAFIPFLFTIILFSFQSHADQTIRYPKAETLFTNHHLYPVELLKLALSYAPEAISVEPSDNVMTQGRAIKQLTESKDIDVMWTMTSKDREAEITPIRIPIYKGLIGWRIFLSTQEWLSDIPNKRLKLEELQKTVIIQGHDWPDTEILKYNQFNVQSGSDYAGLFSILALNRAELFPRSIIEVWDELDTYKSTNIRLEMHNLISYPTATYFFVSPENPVLAQLIENGLRQAHADGRFEELFNAHYMEVIAKSNLRSRQHYRLMNPLLPDKTPLENKAYWFQLE